VALSFCDGIASWKLIVRVTMISPVMMMNSPVPPQLADIIRDVQEYQSGSHVNENAIDQLESKARDAKEHLEKVARPLPDRSKTGTRSGAPACYAFGPENARKAARALPFASTLIEAIRARRWEDAETAARNIQETLA
jgi:hypothetical protein